MWRRRYPSMAGRLGSRHVLPPAPPTPCPTPQCSSDSPAAGDTNTAISFFLARGRASSVALTPNGCRAYVVSDLDAILVSDLA